MQNMLEILKLSFLKLTEGEAENVVFFIIRSRAYTDLVKLEMLRGLLSLNNELQSSVNWGIRNRAGDSLVMCALRKESFEIAAFLMKNIPVSIDGDKIFCEAIADCMNLGQVKFAVDCLFLRVADETASNLNYYSLKTFCLRLLHEKLIKEDRKCEFINNLLIKYKQYNKKYNYLFDYKELTHIGINYCSIGVLEFLYRKGRLFSFEDQSSGAKLIAAIKECCEMGAADILRFLLTNVDFRVIQPCVKDIQCLVNDSTYEDIKNICGDPVCRYWLEE